MNDYERCRCRISVPNAVLPKNDDQWADFVQTNIQSIAEDIAASARVNAQEAPEDTMPNGTDFIVYLTNISSADYVTFCAELRRNQIITLLDDDDDGPDAEDAKNDLWWRGEEHPASEEEEEEWDHS